MRLWNWARHVSTTASDITSPMQLLWEADAVERGVLKGNAEYKKHMKVKILTAGTI